MVRRLTTDVRNHPKQTTLVEGLTVKMAEALAWKEAMLSAIDDVEVGPIDYLVVEWPRGSKPTGEALPLLVDLVDRGLIRILDFGFVRKHDDGSVERIDLRDLGSDPEITVFDGASSGVSSDEDYELAASAIEPGCLGALLVYENTWAAPFATAVRRGGAHLVATGRIPTNAIIAALDELDEIDRKE